MDAWDLAAQIYRATTMRSDPEASRFGFRMLEFIERLRSEFSLDQVRVFTESYTLILNKKNSENYVYTGWDDSSYKISKDFFVTSESMSEDEIIPKIKAYLEL